VEQFKLNLYVHSLDTKVRFNELTNFYFLNILKYFTNKDYAGVSDYFDKILYELIVDKNIFYILNNFDKFLLLLQLKAANVNPEVKLVFKNEKEPGKNATFSINIFKEVSKITENKFYIKDNIQINNNFSVKLSLPKSLFIENYDNVFLEIIQSIKIDESETAFNSLNNNEKNQILENIPGNYISYFTKFIENSNKTANKIFLFKKNNSIPNSSDLMLDFFNNNMLNYLELIYHENLYNFMEFVYVNIAKLNMSLTDFYNQVPSESLLMFNLFKKDLQMQQEEMNKSTESKSKMPPLAKPV